MSPVLQYIAAIARGLNKAELHVLIELAARVTPTDAREIRASSRELAEQTGLSRASVQAAIDNLNEAGLIRSDLGSPRQSALHYLIFLTPREASSEEPPVTKMGQNIRPSGLSSEPAAAQHLGQCGPFLRPGAAQRLSRGGMDSRPEVAQTPGQGGSEFRPVFNEKSAVCGYSYLERANAFGESIDKNLENLIDRLQKSKNTDFDENVFEEARNLIASHHAKFAREDSRIKGLPDDQIIAQFLAVSEWPRLSDLLWDLMSEGKVAGHSYGWYVTVALQRIHGVSPEQVRALRAKQRDSPGQVAGQPVLALRKPFARTQQVTFEGPRKGPTHGDTSAEELDELKAQIRAAASRRSM